jgi:CDP-glycerol glycerophosphotransferase (TagB/SpsB family)
MIKIGMRHGAYHFKEFVSADRYNAFDIYFVTSRREVALARARGITTACVGGFPKLDPAFNGSISVETLSSYRHKLGIGAARQTIIFTTTWNESGSSAIERWIDRLPELVNDYCVLVTVHQWVSRHYKDRLKRMPGISYIEDKDILPYLMVSDLMIGDSSSIIAEFCALDKPMITFRVPPGRRWSEEIENMLNEITIRIDTFDELKPAIEEALDNPDALSSKRRDYTRMMFDDLDGKHAERIVERLRARFPGLL